jgi:hypothetical protein
VPWASSDNPYPSYNLKAGQFPALSLIWVNYL